MFLGSVGNGTIVSAVSRRESASCVTISKKVAMHSATSLRAAIRGALSADAPLAALLGGSKVYDEPPRDAAVPYVTLGENVVADHSTATEPGEAHTLTLHVWSRHGGHKEAHEIAGAVLGALVDVPLALEGHHLANLRFILADVRREPDGRTYHGIVRLRAVTEPM
jgi:hypothetical protein